MRVKLNRDIRMPRTDHGPCAAVKWRSGSSAILITEIDIGPGSVVSIFVA
jgi:hypothetical protein